MKTVSQISSERFMLISILKEWVVFGKNAQFVPPKQYYSSLNQLTRRSESTIQFCNAERDHLLPPEPAERDR